MATHTRNGRPHKALRNTTDASLKRLVQLIWRNCGGNLTACHFLARQTADRYRYTDRDEWLLWYFLRNYALKQTRVQCDQLRRRNASPATRRLGWLLGKYRATDNK